MNRELFPLQQKSEVQKFSIGGNKKSLECFVLGFRSISPNDILPTSTVGRRVFNSLYPIELVKYIYSYTIWCLIEHIYIHIPAGQPSVSVNWLSAKWNSTKWRGASRLLGQPLFLILIVQKSSNETKTHHYLFSSIKRESGFWNLFFSRWPNVLILETKEKLFLTPTASQY